MCYSLCVQLFDWCVTGTHCVHVDTVHVDSPCGHVHVDMSMSVGLVAFLAGRSVGRPVQASEIAFRGAVMDFNVVWLFFCHLWVCA